MMETASHFQDFVHINLTQEREYSNKNTLSESIGIKIADIEDRKIYHLRCLAHADHYFGISSNSITFRFNGKIKPTPIFGRYLVSKEDIPFDTSCLTMPCRALKEPNKKKNKRYTKVKIKDIQTNEVRHFDSMKLAAEFIGISRPIIGDTLNGWIKNPLIKGRYLVALKDDEFISLPEDLSIFKTHISVRKKLTKIIVEKDGIEREFKNIQRFAKFIEQSKDLVYYHIRNGTKDLSVLKGWKVIFPERSFFTNVASPFVKYVKRKERYLLQQSMSIDSKHERSV